jgi:hypothetical protein
MEDDKINAKPFKNIINLSCYMENLTNSAEEVLVDSLSFKLPGSGQYVTERRSTTWHTEGSNAYSPLSGTKVIRFRMAGEGWMDPSTFRIMFDVVNLDLGTSGAPEVLRPIGRPHAFFRRLRIAVRGQIIEDIDNYNRVSELFHILQSPQSRLNDAAEAFGYGYDITSLDTTSELPGISDKQTVMFKPLSGLLSQTKYLPLRYTPLEIELELAEIDDPIVSFPNTSLQFTQATTSVSWRIENCMVKVDMCTLDNALDNSYVSHLLSGKTLNIVYNTFISSLQTVVSAETQINVSRGLSKMKSLFMTLDKNFLETDGSASGRAVYYNKRWNNFWSPLAGTGAPLTAVSATEAASEIQLLQLVVGSKLFPEYPMKSHAECYYSLRKALGVQANNLHNVDITGLEYRNNKFIVGFDTEKLLGLSFTGYNTRNSLMTMRLKTPVGGQPDRMHIVLLSEQIMEVGDVGIMVYD